MPAVAIVTVWLRFPLGMLLYLAALQSINPALLEAAALDGAGRRKRAKITPETKQKVKALVAAGKTGRQVAGRLGISLPSVQNIKRELGLVKRRG